MKSKEVTNYLKAIAIIAVCINHFINGYVTKSLMGYGNGFISIFFILSGYGIYQSLSKHPETIKSGYLLFFFKKTFYEDLSSILDMVYL